MFPAASDGVRQGFARIVNHSTRSGEVHIEAYDDDGTRFGPVTLDIDADATVHFNSGDLEDGNAAKGLAAGTGPGIGDWWLALSSDLDIEVLSYIRTPGDGFLTSMHDVVPPDANGDYRVAIFNPGSNADQVSRLRLVNAGEQAAEVTITGIDDRGASPGGAVRVSVPAGAARTLAADELESGAGLPGALGDGTGKWTLRAASDTPVLVMSLLQSPTGHLTNLSTAPGSLDAGVYTVPLFPAASDPFGRQGFVRVDQPLGGGGGCHRGGVRRHGPGLRVRHAIPGRERGRRTSTRTTWKWATRRRGCPGARGLARATGGWSSRAIWTSRCWPTSVPRATDF